MKNTENKKENPQSPETSESIKQGKQQIEINKNIADKEKPKDPKRQRRSPRRRKMEK